MTVPLNSDVFSAPPTRADIFAIVGPLFTVINNQDLAIRQLISGDRAAADKALDNSSKKLDEAIEAIQSFMGAS